MASSRTVPQPTFFRTAAQFGAWLARHHDRRDEVWVGFYRKDTGRGGITYPEALEEALCWGWIDGIRRRHDAHSYTNRFTPRRPGSNWSAVNLRHYARLERAGRVAGPGRAARAEWDGTKAPYSFEHRETTLAPAYRKRLAAHRDAKAFFASQAPWYRRTAAFWVMNAKREATRERRLDILVQASAQGERIPPLGGTPVKRRASATRNGR